MEDAREYLLRIPSFAREKHSLSQAEAFLRELDCPLPGVVIHVAGTNGKGSVCAFLSSILRASGLHVGTFTSPHLTDIRERICLDGEMIEEEAFQRCFMQVQAAVERMERGGFPHPTFFEYLFYMAAAFFRESRPDAVILEAGMGGLRDVTNVCRPALTVITSVSLDHMAYLGDTVEKIAAEKAGILKPGAPLVFDGNDPAAARVIRERAEQAKVPYFDVREEPLDVSWDGEYPVVTLPFAGGRVSARLPFPALYQVWNSALAVRAAELLWEDGRLGGITPAAVAQGLTSARHAGRMEQVLPGVYLDGAHNRAGVRAFRARNASPFCGFACSFQRCPTRSTAGWRRSWRRTFTRRRSSSPGWRAAGGCPQESWRRPSARRAARSGALTRRGRPWPMPWPQRGRICCFALAPSILSGS